MKPLEGITVLEFSTMITASFAAMMMAEQGAKVIKVEPMNVGDPMRYIGANKGGISSLFANCNRGKQSIRVNLKEEAGQASGEPQVAAGTSASCHAVDNAEMSADWMAVTATSASTRTRPRCGQSQGSQFPRCVDG